MTTNEFSDRQRPYQAISDPCMDRSFRVEPLIARRGQAALASGLTVASINALPLLDSSRCAPAACLIETGSMLSRQVAIVSGERITEVGSESQVKIPAGAQVIDLSQSTVLPGLIDGHSHLFNSGGPMTIIRHD